MPPTISPLFRLRLSALGEDLNTWGDPNLNNALKLIEEAVAGPLTLTITGSRTLTADNFMSNEYRRGTHTLVAGMGLAAPFTLTVPPVAFPYRIDNRTAFPATLKTAAGVGAVVRPGMISAVFCDGTDCKVADPTLDQVKTAAAAINLGGFEIQNAGVATSDTGVPNRGQVLVLTAPAVQLASDWAQKTSGTVDGTEYSAKLWATSTTALTGGNKGAKGYAQDAAASASTSTGSASLAQQWATATGAQVATTDYSAKEYAVGTTVPAGSAKLWATSTTVVAGGLKGGLGYAQDAAGSATSAGNSFLSFDKRYLGTKASDPTQDNQGAALLVGATYFNSTSNLFRVYNGTSWSNTTTGVTDFSQLSGSIAVGQIPNSLITNAKLANMAANTLKGNATGSPAAPVDLTQAQATALLNAFAGDAGSGGTKGLVPAPAPGDAAANKFLKANGTWAGAVTNNASPWTQIASIPVSGTPTTIDFTSIPTTYVELLLIGADFATSGASASLLVSPDGTTYSTGTLPISNFGAGATGSFIAEILNYNQTVAKLHAAYGVVTASPSLVPNTSSAISKNTGGIRAIRLIASGGGTFNSGTFTLYAR